MPGMHSTASVPGQENGMLDTFYLLNWPFIMFASAFTEELLKETTEE